MPRVAKEIKCNDNDIMALKSIVDNPLSDSRLAMKASALLLCISGKENKEVASILGVRQNTVGDWRKAFIEGGIDGLMDKKRPGRRGSNAPDMRERVKEKLKEEPANGETWTAKALSDAVGTSVDTVRRALREEGVSLERRTKWAFPAEGFPSPESIGIAGIYLSDGGKAIVIYTSKEEITSLQHGKVTGKDASSAASLEEILSEEGYLSITDALEILSKSSCGMRKRSHKDIRMQDYLNGIGNSLAGRKGVFLHAIVQKGKDSEMPSLSCPNMSITLAPDFESWLTLAGLWLDPLCGSESSRIRTALSRYTEENMRSREPVIWKGDVAETCIKESDAVSTGKDQEDVFSDPAVDNVLRVNMAILTRDGREIHRETEITNGVPSLSEINYESALTLGASVGKVERSVSKGMAEVAKELCEGYIGAALKKTEHAENG